MGSVFHFTAASETNILDKINSFNTKKPSTLNNIPAKFLIATSDIISPFIAKLDDEVKSNSEFPDSLKRQISGLFIRKMKHPQREL